MATENLKIYEAVRSVPKEAQKDFNNGSFSGTDINPMWRFKMLTEQFGMVGHGWYYKIIEHWSENISGEIHTHVRIELYVRDPETKEWGMPIEGIGGSKSLQVFKSGPKASDEGYKMALTDALSVACKALGIGADIYWQNDPTKYLEYEKKTETPSDKPQKPTPAPSPASNSGAMSEELATACRAVDTCKTSDELSAVWNKYKAKFGTDASFVSRIQKSPLNPNKKK